VWTDDSVFLSIKGVESFCLYRGNFLAVKEIMYSRKDNDTFISSVSIVVRLQEYSAPAKARVLSPALTPTMPIETAIMLSILENCIDIFEHGLSTLSVPTILAGHGHFSSRSNKIMSNERVPFRRSPVTGGGGVV